MKPDSTIPANATRPESTLPTFTAFAGERCVASGSLPEVARQLRRWTLRNAAESLLVFSDLTGELVEIDLHGTEQEVMERVTRPDTTAVTEAECPPKRGPGRPKLGVIPREVTLLPGQWDWLDSQPGGASAALRRLVYEAKRSSHGKDQARQAQEAVYRFMTAMAGDYPGFEEALRSFYRREQDRFAGLIKPWPKDVRKQVEKLVAAANRAVVPV